MYLLLIFHTINVDILIYSEKQTYTQSVVTKNPSKSFYKVVHHSFVHLKNFYLDRQGRCSPHVKKHQCNSGQSNVSRCVETLGISQRLKFSLPYRNFTIKLHYKKKYILKCYFYLALPNAYECQNRGYKLYILKSEYLWYKLRMRETYVPNLINFTDKVTYNS